MLVMSSVSVDESVFLLLDGLLCSALRIHGSPCVILIDKYLQVRDAIQFFNWGGNCFAFWF